MNLWSLPTEWRWDKISDVASIEKKILQPDEIGENRHYIGLDNIEKDTGQLINFENSAYGLIRSSKFQFDEVTILYGKLRPYLNKVYLPNFRGLCSTDILVLRPNDDVIDRRYLGAWMRHPVFVKEADARSTGANLPRIAPSALQSMSVPVPPLDTQRKIVAILDKAEATKRLRAHANELTQKMLKSVFLEMFGDPGTNRKGWEVKPLSELISPGKGIMCGPFGSALKIGELVIHGVPALVISNVDADKFSWDKMKFISEQKAEQLIDFSVLPRDVLVLRTGTVGRACIVPATLGKAIIGPDLLRIRFNTSKMLPEFFSYALNFTPSFLDQVRSISPGATLAHLNATLLRRMEVIAPPIQTQQIFLQRYQQIKRLSRLYLDFLHSEELLFDMLAHKAFTGELVA